MSRRIAITFPLLAACAAAEPESHLGALSQEPRPEEVLHGRPIPQLRLNEYSGSLCPEDTLLFSSNAGAVTITTSTEQKGEQRCQINAEIEVPAGYRFRRPSFYFGGYALREDEVDAAAHITVHYSLGADTLTSEHAVPGLPLSSDALDTFLLTDTPDLSTPECENPEAPMLLDLTLDVEMNIPAGYTMHISALDWEFVHGVRWRECDEEL